eukprot:4357532-Pleurochrysis_carterae.AAC.1
MRPRLRLRPLPASDGERLCPREMAVGREAVPRGREPWGARLCLGERALGRETLPEGESLRKRDFA